MLLQMKNSDIFDIKFHYMDQAFGLIEVLWRFIYFRSFRSGAYCTRILCFTRSKLQHGKYLSRQRVLSGAIIFLRSFGHLRSWETNIRLFFSFFSEGPKSKSVCEWFIDPKDVLRHSFSLIL